LAGEVDRVTPNVGGRSVVSNCSAGWGLAYIGVTVINTGGTRADAVVNVQYVVVGRRETIENSVPN
jgi:hypothetical protein